ncbi:GAF and ANTAR domain-containing protein [Asanoa sp. WMMD1127]|uniref:GAF and ANTAR domain-containing protein n=1 Tax=Asanoa sp. WMMD1127 TaxID=3016107 RepID=UPI002417D0B5|nr:GAF and ANTAR domain-containing protein [Asanoa sp. WMMD1127]MDG4825814.1 GAF and ANTAR domain-containing protein [Asanoa sp. WMMD1127]
MTERQTAQGRPSESFAADPAVLETLATKLSDLARALQAESSLGGTLDAIVATAIGTVPGADFAGISQVENRRRVRTTTGTDDLVFDVDQFQYDLGEGPCLDALYEHRTVRVDDMAVEGRWPRFSAAAHERGIASMLAFQLYVVSGNLGSLNLYSRHVGAFDDESERIGLLFAAHAGVALADAQQLNQLSRALDVRDLIGQAKGILMERHKLTGDQAFALLVAASQTTNTKLLEVARYLVETGELG